MLALAPRSRTYPVLLPDRPSTEREPARRRSRRRPLPTIMALAVVAVLPALALVAQRTEAARTGYVILGLRQQVEVLAAENSQLLATTSALRPPHRWPIFSQAAPPPRFCSAPHACRSGRRPSHPDPPPHDVDDGPAACRAVRARAAVGPVAGHRRRAAAPVGPAAAARGDCAGSASRSDLRPARPRPGRQR